MWLTSVTLGRLCVGRVAGGQLYMWGRVKTTGDNWMYPKPVLDLR